MKKISTRLSAVLFTLISLNSFSQITLIYEDFSTYAGTAGTVPAGWTFSSNGNYKSSFINSGCDSTAYKFGVNNATITTPSFSGADSVSFWLKGTSGIDTANSLTVLETADNITWDTIALVVPLPTTGTTKKYFVKSTSIKLQFIYFKKPGGAGGNLAFDCFLLTGQQPITADFSAPGSSCAGDSTCFTDLSTTVTGTIVSWQWFFADGAQSFLQNPCHTFFSQGTYQNMLVVTNSNGESDTVIKPLTVGAIPVASFMSMDSTGCSPLTVYFMDMSTISAGSITSYQWDLGDGKTSAQQYPIDTFPAGIFQISLIVASNLGCMDTAAGTITVFASPQIDTSAMVITHPNCGASDGSITGISVSGNSPFTYQWTNSTQTTLDLTNVSGGTYTLDVSDTNNCTASLTVALASTGAPSAPTASSPAPYCDGDVINDLAATGTGGTLSWYSDSALTNLIDTGNTFTPTVTVGAHYFYVTETTSCEGPATTVVVTVNPTPVANAGADVSICDGTCTQLAASGGGSYQWSPSGYLDNATIPDATLCPPAPDTLIEQVVVINNFGCSDTDNVQIIVNANPVAGFGFQIFGDTVIFSDSSSLDVVSWFWNFCDAAIDSSPNPTHIFFVSGNYCTCLTVTNASGCTDSVCHNFTITTGINEINFNSSINISPNPSSGKFFISVSNAQSAIGNVSVRNILGEDIYKSAIRSSQSSIDLSGYPEGTYFVTITSGEATATNRIVVVK